MHEASYRGYNDVAELLLLNKADVNAKDNTGWTPVNTAAFYDHKDVVVLLLANKADVNARRIRVRRLCIWLLIKARKI